MNNPARLSFLAACAVLLLAAGCISSTASGSPPLEVASYPQDLTPSTTAFQPLPPTLTFTPAPSPTPSPTPSPSPTPTPVVLVGAGDISICGQQGDMQTADLLQNIPGTIFTAGDNSNENGSLAQYQKCFGPSWGRFLDRLHPSPGNHDYIDKKGQAYYAYFGRAAGEPGKGYYSFDLGGWHIVALNSNCAYVGCGPKSDQVAWLAADLLSRPSKCTLAYFHHPRRDSGFAGNDGRVSTFWRVLYQYGVDVVVNGHEHHYERFAPQDPEGKADPAAGIREFVIGTGGVNHIPFYKTQPNSQVRDSTSFGVLKLTLHPDSYDWEFIPASGGSFHDQGSANCH